MLALASKDDKAKNQLASHSNLRRALQGIARPAFCRETTVRLSRSNVDLPPGTYGASRILSTPKHSKSYVL